MEVAEWESKSTSVLLNPRMQEKQRNEIKEKLLSFNLSGHFWLATSGTQASKFVALSKNALLTSAAAVNQHLKSESTDIWINALPSFHVGGLGIYARAYLSNAQVVSYIERWDIHKFYQLASETQATLTSLVPTQVYDIVLHRLNAPSSMRAVIVGGGALQESLYLQAAQLGWKLLPSYGLTECSSSVATAELIDYPNSHLPNLKILNHILIDATSDNYLKIKSPSLLTGYVLIKGESFQFFDPKNEGWFLTEDKGEIFQTSLRIFGRDSDFVKIGGESSNLIHLQQVLEKSKLHLSIENDVVLLALHDERLGSTIHLVAEQTIKPEILQTLMNHYNQSVLPFERIRKTYLVPKIPRSPLNKVLRAELLLQISPLS